jgi:hypothetical protein
MESSLEGFSDAPGEKILGSRVAEASGRRWMPSKPPATTRLFIWCGRSGGESSHASVGIGGASVTSGEGWVRGIWIESVIVASSGSPPPRIREEISKACGTATFVSSASRPLSLITPFSASRRPVIRGDRLGDIGCSELGVESGVLGEVPSTLSVGTEEWT